jgi:iron(III) transport system permease protein
MRVPLAPRRSWNLLPATRTGWGYIALLMCGAVLLLPLVALVVTGLGAVGSSTLGHVARTILAETAWTSAVLAIGTVLGTLLMGVACAWCVERYEFAGRTVWSWLLVLPLAMPTYVVAYAYTDLLQYSGPIQRALREYVGFSGRLPDVRSLPGAVLLFSCVLYPYVYVMARTAFAEVSASMVESARLLGQTRWQIFTRAVLPSAWPAIAAGAMLVLMETLADVGATHYFGLLTFSAGIYKTWIALGDKQAAVLLAVVLLAVVAVLYWAERRLRGQARRASTSSRGQRPWARETLPPHRQVVLHMVLALPLLAGFMVPVISLLWLFVREPVWVTNLERFWQWTGNTFFIGLAGASLTVLLALGFVYALRFAQGTAAWLNKAMAHALQFGYAVPGAVIALAILWPVAAADRWLATAVHASGPLLTGSLAILVLAYMLRFFSVAFGGLQAGMQRITPHLDEAARTLGATRGGVFARVHWPLLARALLAAWLLVMIDVMKELPATLMLRPFNFDTLAVIAQQLAQDERLAEAALPSLAIVVVGLVPVILISRFTHHHLPRE